MKEINIEKSKQLVDTLILNLESNPESLDHDEVTSVMKFLWEQTNILFDRMQSFQGSEVRSGQDYFYGVELGRLSQQLADYFEGKNDQRREMALRIRLKAILQVQSHYHHIIGPSMLAHSDVLERLGRTDEALDCYHCVISDFLWLIDDYEDNEEVPYEEDIISLESLLAALMRVDAIEKSNINHHLVMQIQNILTRKQVGKN